MKLGEMGKMPTFMILFLLLTGPVQAHTTGQKHVHLSCPGDEHCAAVSSGGEQPPPTQTDKAKTSDKEH